MLLLIQLYNMETSGGVLSQIGLQLYNKLQSVVDVFARILLRKTYAKLLRSESGTLPTNRDGAFLRK